MEKEQARRYGLASVGYFMLWLYLGLAFLLLPIPTFGIYFWITGTLCAASGLRSLESGLICCRRFVIAIYVFGLFFRNNGFTINLAIFLLVALSSILLVAMDRNISSFYDQPYDFKKLKRKTDATATKPKSFEEEVIDKLMQAPDSCWKTSEAGVTRGETDSGASIEIRYLSSHDVGTTGRDRDPYSHSSTKVELFVDSKFITQFETYSSSDSGSGSFGNPALEQLHRQAAKAIYDKEQPEREARRAKVEAEQLAERLKGIEQEEKRKAAEKKKQDDILRRL